MAGRGHGRLIGDRPNRALVPPGGGRGVRPGDQGQGRGQGRGRGRVGGPNLLDLAQNDLRVESTLTLPDNDGPIARDYDEVCDELKVCHVTLTEFLMMKHGFDPVEQNERSEGVRGRMRERIANRYSPAPENFRFANYFRPGVFPNFPKFPKNGNPFELLPVIKDGIYPFDRYGKMLFSTKVLNKWKTDRTSRGELLQVQISKLIQQQALAGRWDACSVPAEFESYGSLALWRQDRDRGGTNSSKKEDSSSAGPSSREPDSGYHSIEPTEDPWAGRSDALPPNEYSWEDETGTGFVSLSDFIVSQEQFDSYVLTQVRTILIFVIWG